VRVSAVRARVGSYARALEASKRVAGQKLFLYAERKERRECVHLAVHSRFAFRARGETFTQRHNIVFTPPPPPPWRRRSFIVAARDTGPNGDPLCSRIEAAVRPLFANEGRQTLFASGRW